MLTLARFTKMALFASCVAGLFVSACHAETMATYSGKYALDLEQKQMLLESIKEDAERAEAGFKENEEKMRALDDQKASRLSIENINLSGLMPPADRMHVALRAPRGMLSPESGLRILKKSEERSRQ